MNDNIEFEEDDIIEDSKNNVLDSDSDDFTDDLDKPLNSIVYSSVKEHQENKNPYSNVCLDHFKNLLNIKKEKLNSLESYIKSAPQSILNKFHEYEKVVEHDQEFVVDYCENILSKLKETLLCVTFAKREQQKSEGLLRVYRERLSEFEKVNRLLKIENVNLRKKISDSNKTYKDSLQSIKNDMKIVKNVENKFDMPKTGICEAYTLSQISRPAYDFVKNVLEYPLPFCLEENINSDNFILRSSIIFEVINEMKLKASYMSEQARLCSLQFYDFEPNMEIADCNLLSTKSKKKRILIGLVEGIYDSWQQPIYIDFNKLLSVEIVHLTIDALNDIGFRVLTLITEFNIYNVRLWRLLNISNDKPYFRSHNGKFVHVVPDIFHLYKSLCERFDDSNNILPCTKSVENVLNDNKYLSFLPLIQSVCFVLKVNQHPNKKETVKFDGPFIGDRHSFHYRVLSNFLSNLLDNNQSAHIGNVLDFHYAICVARNAVKSLSTICKTLKWSMINKFSLSSAKNFANNLFNSINIQPVSAVSVLYYARSYITDPFYRGSDVVTYLAFNDHLKKIFKQSKIVTYMNKLPVEMNTNRFNSTLTSNDDQNRLKNNSEKNKKSYNLNNLKETPVEKSSVEVSDDLSQNITQELRRILDVANNTDESITEQPLDTKEVSTTQGESDENLTDGITNSNSKNDDLKNQIKASIIGSKSNENINEPHAPENSSSDLNATINMANNRNQIWKIDQRPPKILSNGQTLCIKNIQTVYLKNKKEGNDQRATARKLDKQIPKTYTILSEPRVVDKTDQSKITVKRKPNLVPSSAVTAAKQIRLSLPVKSALNCDKMKDEDDKPYASVIGKSNSSETLKLPVGIKLKAAKNVIPKNLNSVKPLTFVPIPVKTSGPVQTISTPIIKPSGAQMKPSTFTIINPKLKSAVPSKYKIKSVTSLPRSSVCLRKITPPIETIQVDEVHSFEEETYDAFKNLDSNINSNSEIDPLSTSTSTPEVKVKVKVEDQSND